VAIDFFVDLLLTDEVFFLGISTMIARIKHLQQRTNQSFKGKITAKVNVAYMVSMSASVTKLLERKYFQF
jgi:hypothetical protein